MISLAFFVGKFTGKMEIIGDGHVGIWARHDTSRHDTTCRDGWSGIWALLETK